MTDLIDSLYRKKFEHSSDPLLVLDGQTGQIVHFNLQALMFLRYPAGTLVEKTWDGIQSPKSATGIGATPSVTSRSEFQPVGIRCGDGSDVSVLVRSEPIHFFERDCNLLHFRLADEAVIPAMVSAPEIPSEADRIRFQNLQAEARWQLLATEVPGLIYQTCGPTDRFELSVPYINDRVEEYLGWTPAEIYESPLRLLQGVHPEDWSRYCDTALSAMASLSEFEIEMRFVSRQSGAVRWFRVCSSPRVLDNGYQLWSGLALDIDELRTSQASLLKLSRNLEERVEERTRELLESQTKLIDLQAMLCRTSRFNLIRQIAAGWAHQVHQPLAAIVNYAAVGLRTSDPVSTQARPKSELFQEIQNQAMRAGDLLRQIRSFVTEQVQEPTPQDFTEIVNSALRLVRVVFEEDAIEYDVDLTEHPAWVCVDKSHVIQVLVDLFVNSVESMKNANVDNPRIAIQLRVDNEHVKLTVVDDGPGIREVDASRIFEQFYSTKKNSLGLGLAMSRAVAETYGGSLDLIPTKNQAVFRLLLPRISENSNNP